MRNGFCSSNRSCQKWSGFEFRHSAGVVAETSERRASRQLRRRPLGSRRHRLGGRHELTGWVRSPEWGHLFANGRLQMKCVAFMRCDSMALFWLFRFLFKLEPTGFPPIGPTLVKQMARKFICPISLKNAKKLWSNFCSSQQWVVFIFVTRASDSLYCDWQLNDVIFRLSWFFITEVMSAFTALSRYFYLISLEANSRVIGFRKYFIFSRILRKLLMKVKVFRFR